MAKLAFSKRCPYCKSSSFGRTHRKFWMHIIPKTKYYVCDKCFRHFIAMFGISDILDRRKYRHYKAQDNVLVNLYPDLSEAFPVVDISRRGLSFRYTTDKEQPTITKELEILLSVKGISVKTPFFIIMMGCELGNELSGSDIGTRVCRGKFINLTRKHKVLLQNIISELNKIKP